MSEAAVSAERCRNCAASLEAEFCSQCGQRARSYRRSLPPMLGELLSEAFEVDGRVVRSLKLLLFFPGALTVEFSADRRASYVSPIRLYLFASLLFFFVLSVFTEVGRGQMATTLEFERVPEFNSEAVALIRSELDPEGAAALDSILERDRSAARGFVLGLIDELTEQQADLSEDAAVGAVLVSSEGGASRAAVVSALLRALDDPAEFGQDFVENAPLALFLLLPAYALLLKLVYLGAGKYLVEHLVFALHIHTIAFLVYALVVALPERWVITEWVTLLGVGGLGIYYALALHRYYQQSWPVTLMKWFALGVLYSALMLPVTALVMVLTVARS